jgi:hypothetical protein
MVQRPPVDTEGTRVFATLFVREYLTWKTNGTGDRATRLLPFLAAHLDTGGGLTLNDQESSQGVIDAWAWGFKALNDQRGQVTVVADVVANVPGQQAPRQRRLALVVPVALTDEGYVIYDYPTFVPMQAPGRWEGVPYAGTPVPDSVPAVRDLLGGFLRAYLQGTQAELSYFLTPGVKLDGLGGQLLFRDLSDVEVLKTGEEYWAVAQALLEDPVAGATYRQRFLVKLALKDRWYVQDIQQKGEWSR